MERVKLKAPGNATGGRYFEAPERHVPCIPSGCCLLDCVLGGGWAIGRMANLVGDNSTGKTLLAIEACANFAAKYPDGDIRYREAEAAFDVPYAESVGLPPGRVDFGDGGEFDTIEHFMRDIKQFLKNKRKGPGLYILDSLDALSDDAEMAATTNKDGTEKGSYGTAKAKALSKFFRKMVRTLAKAEVSLIIISQTRQAIGVMFGEKNTRSGGKALDFYSSQIIWLHQMGKIDVTRSKVKRPIGVDIKARCKKNKIGMPYRTCEFPILFAFGVDDARAGLQWLIEVERTDSIGMSKAEAEKTIKGLDRLSTEEYVALRKRVTRAVKVGWVEVEKDFLPTRRKYG